MTLSRKETNRLSKVANQYDSLDDFDRYLIQYSGKTILKNMKSRTNVLEMGCAGAVMTKMLASRCRHLTVVDGSRKYIQMAQRRVRKNNVDFHISFFENFNADKKFDSIIMASILEHVLKPVPLLRHVKSLLKSKGEIHITVPNAHSLHRQIGLSMEMIRHLKQFSKRDHMLGHRRIYDQKELMQNVRSAGLRIKKISGIFLKPLANSQMESFSDSMLEEFYRMGKQFPSICNYIYLIATA